MPTDNQAIRAMIKKFVEVVGTSIPHESAILSLAKKMHHLSDVAAKKTFRSMQESWKFKDFPRPADWSCVIDQAYTIDESIKKVDEFLCRPEDRPTDEDWEAFSSAMAMLEDKFKIPDDEDVGYLSPEDAIVRWEEKNRLLGLSISHFNALGPAMREKKKRNDSQEK